MGWSLQSAWNPTRVLQIAGSVDSSTGATEVITDLGSAYIKPLGNRQGPHVLATDWVGTHLAKWFGLPTFDVAIVSLHSDLVFHLPRGAVATPGPAFAARAMAGAPWNRQPRELEVLDNPEDITRLVVFDTWTLNCDRHHHDPNIRKPNPDNVFLSRDGVAQGKRRLIAMDHGLCFIGSGEDLSPRLAHIEKVKAPGVYGLFPEFLPKLRPDTMQVCMERLREMDLATASAMVATVPTEWDVSEDAREAWSLLIHRRANFVVDHLHQWISAVVPRFRVSGEE